MTLKEAFKTNCRATAKLCGFAPTLAFSDLTSGIGDKNNNGTIARLSFEDFFVDLYFIENGPLAYAPNTIWIGVGFEVCSFLPISVYDVLALFKETDFKCYTYSHLNSAELIIESFSEIIAFFDDFLPLMQDVAKNGTKKNKLIASQEEAIKRVTGDDVFDRDTEIFDITVKLRDMLLRNYLEGIISRFVLGGVADFYNGNQKRAIRKIAKTKNKTLYEKNLLAALKSGELTDYDASPFRNETYKNYAKSVRTVTHLFGNGGLFKIFAKSALLSPIFATFLGFFYLLLCHVRFGDAVYFLNLDLPAVILLLLAGFLIGEILLFNFPHTPKNPFKKKKTPKIKVTNKSKTLKYFTILVETIVIVLLFCAVNNTVSFTKSSVYFPENNFLSLKQEMLRYEHFEAVYKAKGYYLYDFKYYPLEHYVLVAKNGEKIDLALYPSATSKYFEETVLPFFTENGCEVTEIESERDIK